MSLKSVLGRKDVFALAFGAMIGWGWVVLSGTLIEEAGTLGSMLGFLLGAGLIGPVGLAYAELTSAMPRAGGELAFTYKGLNATFSWICGWALILAYVGVCAFEAVAVATVVDFLLPSLRTGHLYTIAGSEVYWSWILIGMGGCLFIGALNWWGIRASGSFQRVATAGLVVVGIGFFAGSNAFGATENLPPLVLGLEGVLRVAMITPFLMIGFDVIPQASEEMKVPMREVGRILLLSIFLATAWYMLVQWGVGLSLPESGRHESELATADAATAVFGSGLAGSVLVAGGFLGIVSSWNAFFVGATRLVFGMARARMLPFRLSRLHPRHQTPSAAVLFVTACTLFAPFLGREALVWIANAASLAAVVVFFLVSLSFLRLRWRAPRMPRPYRVRFGKAAGAGAVAVSFGFILLYLPFSPSGLIWPQEWLIVLIWVALGAGVFWGGRRVRSRIDPEAQAEVILGTSALGRFTEEDPCASTSPTADPSSQSRDPADM